MKCKLSFTICYQFTEIYKCKFGSFRAENFYFYGCKFAKSQYSNWYEWNATAAGLKYGLNLMGSVTQLKGNKYAAVFGTAEICQLFYFEQKLSYEKVNYTVFHPRGYQNGISCFCTFFNNKSYSKKHNFTHFTIFCYFYYSISPQGIVFKCQYI